MIVEVEHLVWAAVSAVAYESHECEDVRPGNMLISVKSNTTSSMAGNEGGQKGEHTTCYPRGFGEVTVGLDRTKTINVCICIYTPDIWTLYLLLGMDNELHTHLS
jgi:hypothetical protein